MGPSTPHRLTVIEDGVPIEWAMQRLALRMQDLDHAVRIQNGDSVDEMQTGVLEPSGQLAQPQAGGAGGHQGDVAKLLTRLAAIEARLGTSERRA